MQRRYVSIWLPGLTTDFTTKRRPDLADKPFVLAALSHGRMVITAANNVAKRYGVVKGMVVADARAILPELQVLEDEPGLAERLLKAMALWAIRYTPVTAIDLPDGLLLEATGCAHLWGGEENYVENIASKLREIGYSARIGVAGTIGAAWAVCRYGRGPFIVPGCDEAAALLQLPPAALRLEHPVIERLHKFGLDRVGSFIGMKRSALRRRFGPDLLQRLDQALGQMPEEIEPIQPIEPYQERLPCLEPIRTATGIEIALQRLLESLCRRLRKEEKGLRTGVLKAFRMDGKVEQIEIGTNRPSHNAAHLFKLFELKIASIEPDLGIELFVLEAPKIEDLTPGQEELWKAQGGLDDPAVSDLLDRIAGKLGAQTISRYLPQEHFWPEQSIRTAVSLDEKPSAAWRTDILRPMHLLKKPERIEVTVMLPDYPPMLFIHKGQRHKVVKADGPERIEREWWMDRGPHRDYYRVEDELGQRYWIFRSGHYDADNSPSWFLHGFFA